MPALILLIYFSFAGNQSNLCWHNVTLAWIRTMCFWNPQKHLYLSTLTHYR